MSMLDALRITNTTVVSPVIRKETKESTAPVYKQATASSTSTKKQRAYSSLEIKTVQKILEDTEAELRGTVLFNDSDELQEKMAELRQATTHIQEILMDKQVSINQVVNEESPEVHTTKGDLMNQILMGYDI